VSYTDGQQGSESGRNDYKPELKEERGVGCAMGLWLLLMLDLTKGIYR